MYDILVIRFVFERMWSARDLWYSWSCLGEVHWAGENAGNMHSKKSTVQLFRFWVCFFCTDWCDLHIRSIWLGQRRLQGYDSAVMLFLLWPNMHLSLYSFSVRNRYAPRLHARMCGPRAHEHCAKSFFCALSCCFVICELSAGPHMIPRFEHKPLLVWGSVHLCFVQSLPYTMIYKEGTCLEGLHASTLGS
jgi:hypothetical protein